MIVCKTVSGISEELERLRKEGKTVGLVPTMGALHKGHLSLVNRCLVENDVCVVSVFVNPTQFNNQTDLEKYPRTVEADLRLLEEVGCSIAFVPSVEEIYPEPDTRVFNFAPLDQVMEGPARPGHFNGVGQVVSRLFDIVKPSRAYFGEKDFQQLAIIRIMVERYNYPIDIVGCPIVREESGLAFSSRNARLSESEKVDAVQISKKLTESISLANRLSVEEVKNWVIKEIEKTPTLRVEYYEIVDSASLQSVNDWAEADHITGCITVYCGEVRLIDNIQYK